MLECLLKPETWNEFYEYKHSHYLLDKREDSELLTFIKEERYIEISKKIIDGEYVFSIPTRKEISKMGTKKKRVVYTFNSEENIILKMLAYLLYEYDNVLSPNCYAFRRDVGAKTAFIDLIKKDNLKTLSCFKADISNYFNSINVDILEKSLTFIMKNDTKFLNLLLSILKDDRALWQGSIIHEKKGVMAGTPISPFLANIYLSEMDSHFYNKNICYVRYSDDIIIFDKEENLSFHIEAYREFIDKYNLESNPDKEQLVKPGEKWNFLGFEYDSGKIDISKVTVKKLMGKIRRSARSIRRWMLRKNASIESGLKVFNRKLNKKFYSKETGRELCWARWYFPLINTSESLHIIDTYMQQYQRYIATGTQKKSAYGKAPYELLKKCGYRPLVHEYYKK